MVYEICERREDVAKLTKEPDGDSHEERRSKHAAKTKEQSACEVHDVDLSARAMEVVE